MLTPNEILDSEKSNVERRDSDIAVAPPQQRKIIHIDMDAFYASVEQRDNPELRGKPVAVGGSRERGVVAAASYEARKFGVRSAMPSVTAKRNCPELIFVKPRFDVYKDVSRQIRAIFAEYTPIIEPLSLDEAYLDVTENLKGIASATQIAEDIRARIHTETGLTASAGVSYNKFLAKLASDHSKPDGLFVITPKMGPAFVEALAGREIPWRRAGNDDEDEPAWDRNRARPQSADACFPSAPFREVGAVLLLDFAGRRRPAGPRLTACASRWAPKTPLSRISSPSQRRAPRSSRSSKKSGATARAREYVGAPSH